MFPLSLAGHNHIAARQRKTPPSPVSGAVLASPGTQQNSPRKKRHSLVVLLLLLFCTATAATASQEQEKVVLQLHWHHQFQFAGYYAALAQGYYREAGLDVTVQEINPQLHGIDEVMAGRAQYGVGNADLLLHYLNGKPVVALAAIFQHSASVFLARADSGIRTPQDMVGKRVMMMEGIDAAEYVATFQRAGVATQSVDIIPSSFNIDDLIQGKTDVFNAYLTNEPFLLQERTIPYTVIKPTDYGINFYGDTLFTSQQELTGHPERVKAFRNASLRGWEYAFAHPEEIIDLLLNAYHVEKSRTILQYEAEAMKGLVLSDFIPIGHMHLQRWQEIAATYEQLGMASAAKDLKDFLYTPPPEPDSAQLRRFAAWIGLLFVLLSLSLLLFFNQRMKKILAQKTAQLSRNERLFREVFNNMLTGAAIYEAVDQGRDFLFKDLNPAGCAGGHVRREEILGKSVKEVFSGVEELGLFAVFQRVWLTGEPEHHPSSCYRDNHVTLWVENYVCKLPSGEIVALYDDITAQKEGARKQALLQQRLESLWQISTMLNTDLKSICDAILAECLTITSSKYGFYGFLNDNEQTLELASWSEDTMKDCGMMHTTRMFPLADSGIWGNAVRERSPFLLNDYSQDCPHKKGTPVGHVPLTRLIAVPIFHGDTITAMATVANKETDYSQDELAYLVMFLQNTQLVVERKKQEQAIVLAKKEWQNTFDAIPDLVSILDRNMRIVRANKAAHLFFKANPGGLNGKSCHELFCESGQPCPNCPAVEKLQLPESCLGAMPFINQGRTFLVSLARIKGDDEGNPHFVHIAKDITEEKRLEEDLFQAQKMEALGTLAGGITHDFNNILSAIQCSSELAQRSLPPGTTAIEDIGQVLSACKRARALTQQILDFSHKGTPTRQALQPHLLLKEVLGLLRAGLPNSIEMQEEIDPDCGYILADPAQLHQVVMNLCTNAIHAMEERSGTLKIALTRQEEDATSYIVLTVSDTGQGMDPETLSHIFEPYYTTRGKGKGCGLGLAVVHGIIKGYDGFIRVESKAGEGSAFRVYIPALTEEAVIPEHPAVPTNNLSGKEHILVVDDEALLVRIHQRILEDLGYTVTGMTDSREALQKVLEAPQLFDLIITDQTMPGLTGSELAVAVLQVAPDMPIILCTGHSGQTPPEEVLALGIRQFLHKPIEGDALIRTIRRLLDDNQ